MGRIKLNKDIINVRVKAQTRLWFSMEAVKYGYVFGDEGQTGAFLDAIADGEFQIVKVEKD
ncbi:hypothetical protein H6H01_01860 [Nostoc calcicola FACHB-3891]|nr:hypothetical protein [Nostoc calcicola FACHB-3891]